MDKRLIILLIFLMALLTVACGSVPASDTPGNEFATSTQEVPEVISQPTVAVTDEVASASCPEATDETYLLRDPRHGFCLLYPITHRVERPNPDEVVIVVGGLLNAGDPRVMINVTASSGRTAADHADEIVAGFEGFEIARSETTVAGESAVVLDNVPGQDINRRVIFTHEDRLYDLYISPIDPADTNPIDSFAEGILQSFTFIPVSETATAADECVAPKAEQQQITSEAFGYCFLAPAGFTYEEPGETNAILFVGSMMDVEHPKLMIEVTDAGGKTAAVTADELAASFEGFEMSRTFGDTLGYEPAERLDGVPGQDIGRVLLAVHGDKLYQLTFVPADASQGAVYEQMETLFAQVMQTFRFLP